MVVLARVDHRDNQSHDFPVEGRDLDLYCRTLLMAAGHDEHGDTGPTRNYDHLLDDDRLVVVRQDDAGQVARVVARNY